MAAKKKKGAKARKSSTSGGSMMSMRSGFQSMIGTKKKGRKGKKELTFTAVLTWLVIGALVLILIWQLAR